MADQYGRTLLHGERALRRCHGFRERRQRVLHGSDIEPLRLQFLGITSDQHEPSAKSPWTRTMLRAFGAGCAAAAPWRSGLAAPAATILMNVRRSIEYPSCGGQVGYADALPFGRATSPYQACKFALLARLPVVSRSCGWMISLSCRALVWPHLRSVDTDAGLFHAGRSFRNARARHRLHQGNWPRHRRGARLERRRGRDQWAKGGRGRADHQRNPIGAAGRAIGAGAGRRVHRRRRRRRDRGVRRRRHSDQQRRHL